MTAATVSMDIRTVSGRTGVISIKGDVTSTCEGVLTAAHDELTAAGVTSILLDFTGLDYMNSGGIGMVVTMLVRANRQRQALLAYGLALVILGGYGVWQRGFPQPSELGWY